MPNGNKFKGNNKKKGFRKKNPYTDFDETIDEYAKVLSLQGGKHLTVQLLSDTKDKTVSAIIKGSHHRKIWYKKDELVIVRSMGNLYEVQGKISNDELKIIQQQFDKLEGNTNNTFTFDDDPLDMNNTDTRKINIDTIDKNTDDFDFDSI